MLSNDEKQQVIDILYGYEWTMDCVPKTTITIEEGRREKGLWWLFDPNVDLIDKVECYMPTLRDL